MNNSLKYVKILESTGISREQAEAHVQIVTEITEGDLATKQDLKNLETKVDSSIERLDRKLDAAVERLDHKIDSAIERFEHKLLQAEYRLTIKLGTIVTVVMAAATTVIKVL